jgi:hypothetical protein
MDVKTVDEFLKTLLRGKQSPSVKQMEFVFATVVIARLYYPGGWLSDESYRTYVITKEGEALVANQLWNAAPRAWEKITINPVELVMCEFDNKARRLFDPDWVEGVIEETYGHVEIIHRKVYSQVDVHYPSHMGYKHIETFLLLDGKWVEWYEEPPT